MNNTQFIFISLAILAIIIASVAWLISISNKIDYPFAYASGLVMLLTPCSLPILLVITSLTIKQKSYDKALLTSIAFSIGMVIFAAILGLMLSLLGLVILPSMNNILFAIGGSIGYTYALKELFELKIPILGLRVPSIKGSSYMVAFTIGLLLALGDIGCPNPFRYALLSFIVAARDIFNGTMLGLLYGLGSITPLIFIATFALFGLNLTSRIVKHTHRLEQMINFSFLPIGSFLITFGVFGEEWYESTFIHDVWEAMLLQLGLVEAHDDADGSSIANIVFVALIAIPLLAYAIKRRYVKEEAE